ncbi:MAG TPA: zinc ribbon domain-containing protein [Dehalococcoidia bacterium]|jgi:putative FmdB family regulatory protein|nr:zinc ribbon domain-containing protein [Dehalococcoidia bacterium]
MPLYEYYCQHCHGIFEEIRQIRDASAPAPCPECSREAPRIMSSFSAFTMREGYPRRIPDKGTYWHMGREVKKRAKTMVGHMHPELAEPKPPRHISRGERVATADKAMRDRADALYKDKWGVMPDGRRSVKAKKIKPARKTI